MSACRLPVNTGIDDTDPLADGIEFTPENFMPGFGIIDIELIGGTTAEGQNINRRDIVIKTALKLLGDNCLRTNRPPKSNFSPKAILALNNID